MGIFGMSDEEKKKIKDKLPYIKYYIERNLLYLNLIKNYSNIKLLEKW